MSIQFEQAYKDYCDGKVDDPTELLRVIWEENKEAIEAFKAKEGFYTKQRSEQRSEQQSQVEEMLRYEIDALEEKLAECRTQREWRGLTPKEELDAEAVQIHGIEAVIRWVEAKLKDKNT